MTTRMRATAPLRLRRLAEPARDAHLFLAQAYDSLLQARAPTAAPAPDDNTCVTIPIHPTLPLLEVHV